MQNNKNNTIRKYPKYTLALAKARRIILRGNKLTVSEICIIAYVDRFCSNEKVRFFYTSKSIYLLETNSFLSTKDIIFKFYKRKWLIALYIKSIPHKTNT